MQPTSPTPPPVSTPAEQPGVEPCFWPEGWWKLMEYRIGIIPLPVYVILLALIAGFALTGKMPGEIPTAIAVLAFFGFTCAEVGKRLPIARNIGGAAISATFIPSALTYCHLLPKPTTLHADHGFHEIDQFPLPVHCVDHRGQHSEHGPTCADPGFSSRSSFHSHSARSRLASSGRWSARRSTWCAPYVLYIVVPIMAGGIGEGRSCCR